MFASISSRIGATKIFSPYLLCSLILVIINVKTSYQQSDLLAIKTDPFYIDLYHKFNSKADFVPRGSILVRPKTEYRSAQASIVSQNDLNESDLKSLEGKVAENKEDSTYYLRAVFRKKKSHNNEKHEKVTETIVKSCSLYSSNLNDFLVVNLNALNEFISVNLYTTDPECTNPPSVEPLSSKFNTTVLIEPSTLGPQPDTATYIKRLEEERQNKMKEGKEDNRSFLAKYWIYIVPGVIILMMLGGPDQGAR
uniref:ER membrane protein complex subunit 10 n=1 Tax=Aceria tosichella TaxID=561515 RepID=A0A6G1S7Y6_9ACAR